MKPDTQKTTKAVREAPRCSCGHPDPYHCGQPRFPQVTDSRYTVELTTEGWQVKRPDGSYIASAFAERGQAQQEADYFNETAEADTNN